MLVEVNTLILRDKFCEIVLSAGPSTREKLFTDFDALDIYEKNVDFKEKYEGRVAIVTNVASE